MSHAAPNGRTQSSRGAHRDADALLDRSPPHSLEAESGVLGSLMLDPRLVDDVGPILRAHEFYSPAHRRLYEVVLELHAAGKWVDVPLTVDRLKSSGDFDVIGGYEFLRSVVEAVPTAANAVWYARIVRDKAVVRNLIHASTDILREAYEQNDPDELLTRSQQLLADVAERGLKGSLAECADAVADAVASFTDRCDNGTPAGLATGWPDVDRQLGGLRAGELVIVAARPGAGKTSFAMGLTENVATAGSRVLFVSLEMSRLELGERLLASRSGVPLHLIRRGTRYAGDREAVHEAQHSLGALAITFDDTSSRSTAEISATARRLKRQGGLSLVVIDYLQLITAENSRDPREQQVAKSARQLKTLARELRIPIVCLAQLNREVEKQTDHKPRLSHLRESGAIEQDADVVLFVHREEMFRPDDIDLRGKAELVVAKNRNGRTGSVPLTWLSHITSFTSVADDQHDTPKSQPHFEFT